MAAVTAASTRNKPPLPPSLFPMRAPKLALGHTLDLRPRTSTWEWESEASSDQQLPGGAHSRRRRPHHEKPHLERAIGVEQLVTEHVRDELGPVDLAVPVGVRSAQ